MMTEKPVSDYLFVFEPGKYPHPGYERCSARELGLDEAWLRDAIFNNPGLVIGPCDAAGLSDDEWYPWQREFGVDVGRIDVLLLSSQGRVAIVETKLATNPELRRRVLAQVLDYLTHLADRFEDDMPDIPLDADGRPVAEPEDIRESIAQGDVLVIIASDEVDARVSRLSQTLLSGHFIKQWDLALIDVALYRPLDASHNYLVVPHLRNVVRSVPRQVVKIIVEGETPRARIEIERITRDVSSTSTRQRWDEQRFFQRLEDETVPEAVRKLARGLRTLARRYPESMTLAWGTAKHGSMIVKRHNGGLIEVFGSGEIKFRPKKFARALGEEKAKEYFRALKELLPEAMKMDYPRLSSEQAVRVAPALYDLLERTLESVEKGGA